MIITCGQCQAKFKVAPEQIKETGSKVRCSNCRYVFTVYRPKRPVEAEPLVLDDLAEAGGTEADDFYDGRTAAGRPGPEAEDYGEEASGDERSAGDSASLKERRDRRRRLYSDVDDEAGDSDFDDDQPDEDYDDDPEFDDDRSGLPPLRRNRGRRPSPAAEPEDEDYSSPEEEDDFGEPEDEFDRETDRDRPAGAPGDLGLGADPVEPETAEPANLEDSFARLAAGYRGHKGPGRAAVGKKSKLVAGLALLAALLAVGLYFLGVWPKEAALIPGDEPPASGGSEQTAPADQSASADAPDDPNGTLHIGFIEEQQSYFYRKNQEAGNILILTGRVRNNYAGPRSFIYLRGHLLSANEETLADRFAYAGTLLNEEELTSLPMKEITARLLFKGGKDNANIGIPSGAEIPFMMVFDNVPDGTDQYRIDAVSSEPAQ